jgi:hypothetical protein
VRQEQKFLPLQILKDALWTNGKNDVKNQIFFILLTTTLPLNLKSQTTKSQEVQVSIRLVSFMGYTVNKPTFFRQVALKREPIVEVYGTYPKPEVVILKRNKTIIVTITQK